MSRLQQPDAVVTLEALLPEHWDAVRRIFEEGIATGDATFETAAPEWAEWDAHHLRSHRVVARRDGEVVGWAALSPTSGRCVYSGVAEERVYVAASARGMGIGRSLLQALVEGAEQDGIWTVQACVFPENAPSIALHLACGFRIVGVREKLGQHHGVWRDVVLLERRSATAGTR